MNENEFNWKVARLIVVAIVIVLLSIIGSCAYTVNQPANLTCEGKLVIDEDRLSLQNCRFPSTVVSTGYNIILTIDKVR